MYRSLCCKDLLLTGKLSLGPSHWRLNTQLLENEEYVKTINESIPKWKTECNNNDSFVIWEYLKYKIRPFSISFSKRIASSHRNKISNLEELLNELKSQHEGNNNKSDEIELIQDNLNLEYEKMARGTILRSKAQYYEEGEKCTKYFFNLEKDNKEYHSKIKRWRCRHY